jgi:drug/metabolite transporter (DMT)-like permease
MTTPIESILWVFFASFVGSFGAVFLKWGAARLRFHPVALITNWRLAIGVGLYVLSSAFYLRGISKGELSILFPMVSFGYVWTLLWSKLFFAEPMTHRKLAGIGIILAGIIVLNLGR